MGQVSRTLGLVSGVVFSGGFIYALRKNIEKDIHSQQERLKDVEYNLNTAFLSEAKKAEIEDKRPLYREVHNKPYVLEILEEGNKHTKEVIIPEVKKEWNQKIYQLGDILNNGFDFKRFLNGWN